MFVRFFVRGCPAMAEILRCSVADCEESAAGSLEGRSFCREHFISACYEQLDQCRNWQEARLSPDRTSESVRQFLGECYRQVAQFASNVKEFTGLERAQLIDILLRATDLSRQLRQSPRLAASIPVELRCEEPGGAWEEETDEADKPLWRVAEVSASGQSRRNTSCCAPGHWAAGAGPGGTTAAQDWRGPRNRHRVSRP